MNFPSVSISSTLTGPRAEAECAMDTELLASCSSTSSRFLLPLEVWTLRLLDEARDTVTRAEGLGDSFSLGQLAVGVDLHVQRQLDVQQLHVVVQLLLHLQPERRQVAVSLRQQLPALVLLLRHRRLQLRHALTPASSLLLQPGQLGAEALHPQAGLTQLLSGRAGRRAVHLRQPMQVRQGLSQFGLVLHPPAGVHLHQLGLEPLPGLLRLLFDHALAEAELLRQTLAAVLKVDAQQHLVRQVLLGVRQPGVQLHGHKHKRHAEDAVAGDAVFLSKTHSLFQTRRK
ncbi:hypothetical protein EYF80_050278 [Liparis tanakae]|uniref:Uncharacterized protein n=1 Tax=Liparis tanakae TaxID=230148 RepID=A0A4Z2FED5_9TELE|nr:hypothetical protein EYF80_050278 [Liparis tanakae]